MSNVATETKAAVTAVGDAAAPYHKAIVPLVTGLVGIAAYYGLIEDANTKELITALTLVFTCAASAYFAPRNRYGKPQ